MTRSARSLRLLCAWNGWPLRTTAALCAATIAGGLALGAQALDGRSPAGSESLSGDAGGAAIALPQPRAQQQLDFSALADAYLAAHPVAGKTADTLKMEDVVAAHFLPASVGAIELRFPRAFLGEKSVVENFKAVVVALLTTHATWLDLLACKGEAADTARADIAAVLKWLKTAKPANGDVVPTDFFGALQGGAALAPQIQRLAEGFRTGAAMSLKPRGGKLQVLVVSPSREDFLQLAGVFGKLEPDSRSMNWNDQLMGWTEFGWNELQIVALVYPPVTPKPDKLNEGMPMDLREPTGLYQHVAQRCAVQLSWHTFDKLVDPAVEMALAQALVVDMYGENNTRSGGASRGNTTDGITAFIPGGNSNGGALPPTNAESGWRTTSGKDYFVKPLRTSQKLGSKAAKDKEDKNLHFQLTADNTATRVAVRMPFLGAAAQGKALPPPEFMTDYQEFFRAYKTAFANWMRNKALKTPAESRAKFAELLNKVVEVGSAATFEELVQETYGKPLSSADLAAPNLEREFLEWLATQ
jgi:hypothetical protein